MYLILEFELLLEEKILKLKLNPIVHDNHNMVKHMFKILQQMLQDL